MTTLTNNCDGSDGTTVTTSSSGAGQSQWDTVDAGTGATIAYSVTHIAHGTSSIQLATGGTAADFVLRWDSSVTSAATYYYRLYVYQTGNPAESYPLVSMYDPTGADQRAAIVLEPDGTLNIQDSAFGNVGGLGTSIPLNAWFRLEGFITGNAATGQVSLSRYDSMDSATATATTTTAASKNTGGSVGQAFFGSFARANVVAWWLDEAGISSDGPLGPFTAFTAPPGLIVRQAIQASLNA